MLACGRDARHRERRLLCLGTVIFREKKRLLARIRRCGNSTAVTRVVYSCLFSDGRKTRELAGECGWILHR